MQEINYALKVALSSKSGGPEIVPIVIEGPPVAPPPEELKNLHFNDQFIYFIKGSE